MLTSAHAKLLKPRNLDTYKRLSLYRKWRPLVLASGRLDVLSQLERARVHDTQTLSLEKLWHVRWNAQQYKPETSVWDTRVDRILEHIHELIQVPMQDSHAASAARLMDCLFPSGVEKLTDVDKLTDLPYIERVAAVEQRIERLKGDLFADVEALGLEFMLAQLAQATRKYREAVGTNHLRLRYDEIREARQRGVAYVSELVSVMMGVYENTHEPDDEAARQAFLAPLELTAGV